MRINNFSITKSYSDKASVRSYITANILKGGSK